MADVNDILGGSDEFTDEQLMNFLNGNLSGEALQHIEEQIKEDAFVKDAVDGLQQFSSNKKLDEYVKGLNKNLQQQLSIKKQRSAKRKLSYASWIVIATVLILLLCVLAYVVVTFVKNS